METFKYWWKTLIWHPLDVADRILVLVGAIAGFLNKGDSPMTANLVWQIPLAAIIVLLVWRIMQLPVKIIHDIQAERMGTAPLTLEKVGQRIKQIEATLESLQERIIPQHTFNVEGIKSKIFWDFKICDYSAIGGITRAIVFIFAVTNASDVWIEPTGKTKGDLIVEAWRLIGVHWQVICNEIEPNKKGELRIVFPVSENFARTLAFKPKNGNFSAEFSEMFIEFRARDSHQSQTLDFIPIGKRYDVPIDDHPSFQKIRKVVEWEEQLGQDERIMR